MSNVENLHGGPVIQTAQPRESVISELERILEMARVGEVQGIACAILYSDKLSNYSIAGVTVPYSLIGAIEVMKANLLLEEVN